MSGFKGDRYDGSTSPTPYDAKERHPKMAEFEGTGINIIHMRGRYNMIKAQKPSGGTVNPDDCARLSICKSVSLKLNFFERKTMKTLKPFCSWQCVSVFLKHYRKTTY